jgi:NAD(P)-dependent dehydrogenase (short-subunit alcohol dehydrogenase family)
MHGRLLRKRCLIVGGTSGIGLASVRRFLDEGAKVVIAGINVDGGQQVAAEMADHTGAYVAFADVTDPKSVDALFETALDLLGGLDVMFHVAGGSGRCSGDGSLHDCTDDGWRDTLDLNLTGTFLTNRTAVRHFRDANRPGVILNTASVLALDPEPTHFDTCAYAAAKGGVIALSRQIAAKYAGDGIRVNVLAPGLIDTPMSARAVADPAVAGFLRTKQPLADGAGRPEDCAEAAVFLCGDESRLITGAVLAVDGGWLLR